MAKITSAKLGNNQGSPNSFLLFLLFPSFHVIEVSKVYLYGQKKKYAMIL